MTTPVPGKLPVTRKVKAATGGATIGSAVAGLVVWTLQHYVFRGHMDPVLQAEVYAALPGILAGAATFVSGYLTKHGVRDLPTPTAAQIDWLANYIETHVAPPAPPAAPTPQGHWVADPVQVAPGQAVQVTPVPEVTPPQT
jgi:hypothetical protein